MNTEKHAQELKNIIIPTSYKGFNYVFKVINIKYIRIFYNYIMILFG